MASFGENLQGSLISFLSLCCTHNTHKNLSQITGTYTDTHTPGRGSFKAQPCSTF